MKIKNARPSDLASTNEGNNKINESFVPPNVASGKLKTSFETKTNV